MPEAASGPSPKAAWPRKVGEVEVQPRPSCCVRHSRCIFCSICCLAFLLVIAGVLTVLFWPRLILMCVRYAEMRGDLNLRQSPSSPFLAFAPVLTVPMTIDNYNLWTLSADVTLTAYASGGTDAPMVRGSTKAYMHPNVLTEFEMVLDKADGRTDAQALALMEAVRAGCGDNPFQWQSRSWAMDLHMEIDRIAWTTFAIDFWMRDIAMPCDGGVGSAAGSWSEAGNCQTMSERMADEVGEYCVAFFCGLDDLDCSKEQCPEGASPPPSAAPSAASRLDGPVDAEDPVPPPPAKNNNNNPFVWLQGLFGRR